MRHSSVRSSTGAIGLTGRALDRSGVVHATPIMCFSPPSITDGITWDHMTHEIASFQPRTP